MKKILCAFVLGATGFAAAAQNLSDQDINLMTASAKAVKVYTQDGIGGVFSAVGQCYGHLHQGQEILRTSVEFCVALDISGIFIDAVGIATADAAGVIAQPIRLGRNNQTPFPTEAEALIAGHSAGQRLIDELSSISDGS